MGCASSKKQAKANAEEWNTQLFKSMFTQDQSFDDYHLHQVSLTSSSYGLLKVDPPKSTEDLQNKSDSGADSVNEVYEKLWSFELAPDSAPKAWTEVSSMLENLKPGLDKSNSSPRSGRTLGQAGSEVAREPEIIDVSDIMKEMDDETPRGLSPVKTLGPTSTDAIAIPRMPRLMDKSLSFHTVEELDAHLGRAKLDAASAKRFKDPKGFVRDTRNSLVSTSGFNRSTEQNGFGKENAKLPGSAANDHLSAITREGALSFKKETILRSPFVEPHVNSPSPRTLRAVIKESSGNSKDTGETESVPKNIATATEGKSSTSRIKHTILGTTLPKGTLADTLNLLTESISPLFDPDLLASYEKGMSNLSEDDWHTVRCNDKGISSTLVSGSFSRSERRKAIPGGADDSYCEPGIEEDGGEAHLFPKTFPSKVQAEVLTAKKVDLLESFENRCPPIGENTLVLYTTTLRGIRKTFEDCNRVRGFIQSFGVSIDERDCSMHLEFRNELSDLMGKIVSVPRLFIKGRYIGGVEDVAKILEDGKLDELLQGLPKVIKGGACDGCGGMRFVPCLECSGSCKVLNKDDEVVRCPNCNENGLIQCPICS